MDSTVHLFSQLDMRPGKMLETRISSDAAKNSRTKTAALIAFLPFFGP
jgi:hypothetical protein